MGHTASYNKTGSMAQIHIPNPCGEAWGEMTPEGNGRHCAQCCRTVVDFTQWQQEDIIVYLQEQKGRTCGRFTEEQVAGGSDGAVLQSLARAAVPLMRKVAAIVLLVFGVMAEGCSSGEVPATGEPKFVNVIPVEQASQGAPVVIREDTVKPAIKVVKRKKKVVPRKPQVIVRDVIPEVMGVPEWAPEPPYVDTGVRK